VNIKNSLISTQRFPLQQYLNFQLLVGHYQIPSQHVTVSYLFSVFSTSFIEWHSSGPLPNSWLKRFA